MAEAFKGGPKEEQLREKKQESRLESSLGQRGMSGAQMMGKPETGAMLRDMRGRIGSAVRGFLGRLKII